MNFENRPTHSLRPYPGNARTHSPKQIKQISRSIERFGFNNPVLVDDDDQIIAGHGRVEAAKLLNMKTVPTVRLSHLSEAEKKAYILADNRLAEKAGWDNEVLAIELQGLVDLGFLSLRKLVQNVRKDGAKKDVCDQEQCRILFLVRTASNKE